MGKDNRYLRSSLKDFKCVEDVGLYAFTSENDEDAQAEQLTQQLQQTELKQAGGVAGNSGQQAGADVPSYLGGAGASGTSGSGSRQKKGACNLCGLHGHWARECPEQANVVKGKRPRKPRQIASVELDDSNLVCWKCGKQGHRKLNCPNYVPHNKGGGRPPRAAATVADKE